MLCTFFHIPIATGPFAMMPAIGHESTNFYGSLNTFAEGCRLSPANYMVMTCNDVGIPLSLQPGKRFKPIPSLFAPTSFSISIPSGAPVFVGGPYVPDWDSMLRNMAMGFGFGSLMKTGGKFMKKAGGKAKALLTKFNHEVLKKSDAKWAKNLGDRFCKYGFEPVNLITGAVVYDGVDFELPGPLPLAWKRRWMSDSLWQGLLGHGCHCNFDMRVERFPEYEAIAVTLSDGRPAAFTDLPAGESDFNRVERLTLHHRGRHYELFDHSDRRSYIFPIERDRNEYRLTEVRNEAGHSIRLRYLYGSLQEITDSAGRQLRVKTDREGRITQVDLLIDYETRETLVSYAYNTEGDMTEITDALGQTTRMVYGNHLMTSKTDRNGQTFYWEYDGAKPKSRCIHTLGDGRLLEGRIKYHDGYNLVTDSLGNTTRYEYTPDFRITSVTDPLGATTLTDFTPEGDIMREIDPAGNITGYAYDDRGQLTSIHYPDGTDELFGYTPEGRLDMEVTRGNAVTIYFYGENGLTNKILYPDHRLVKYFYNEHNLISCVKSDNREITLSYDGQHNLVKATLPDGYESVWEYDHRGRVLRSSNAADQMHRYKYDALGRLVQTIAPDGRLVTLTYNAYEEVIRAEDRERKVEFGYTPLGSLKTRKENGKTLLFRYNTEEQLTSLKNEAGEQYSFQRDAAGRIIEEKSFDGLTRTYERDAKGLVRHVERPGGKTSDYIYDTMGRLCGVEYSDGTFEQYSYNDDGLLTAAKNPDSHLKITRDKTGRVTEEWQDGHTVTSRYDEATGRRAGVTSSLGADLKTDYTAAGMLQGMQSGDGWGMSIQYNRRGQEIERVLSGGVVCRSEYDLVGRIHRHTVDTGGKRTRQMRYDWSQNDRLKGMVNELIQLGTWFDYDTMGNLVRSTHNETERLFRVPDAVGNLYRKPDMSDRKYGAGGRLLETENTKYHYDDEGNVIAKVIDNAKVWLYKWNANGSLKEVTRPDKKKVQFEYDALGRRTVKTYNGKVTRWVWDGNTPLHEWTYDEKERPKIITDEFGLMHKEGTEPTENITTWVFEEGSFRPAAKLTDEKKYSIIADYLGTPVQMYDEEGKLTWEARLDIYGKVGTFAGSSLSDCPFRYQGQYHDAETDLYYNRFRYYDPDSANYLSQDPIGLAGNNPTLYGYAKDVNNWIDVFGLDCFKAKTNDGQLVDVFRGGTDFTLKPGEFRVTPNGVYPAKGLSLNADPFKAVPYGGAYRIVSIPDGLDIIHTPSKANPMHFDVIPKDLSISDEGFQNLLNKIKIEPL
jgi:RHS repeat-associated protein